MARILATAALIAAVALVALALFGGGDAYKVEATFVNAGQLVKGNEVRVGGQPIGKITDIELDDRANAVVTMEVEDEVAPLHEGTTATIRATSLSGIANRYVSLKPGPNNAERIEDGGRIGTDSTTSPVDIDVLFNALDKKTRGGLRNLIRGTGTQYDSRGVEAGESIKYFGPFLASTSRLTQELALDQRVLTQFLKDGADTVSAIAERRDDLTDLVSNTNTAMRAIGDENVSLQRALELLPDTLRKANTTFVNLRTHARRPRPAGQRVEAEHEGARAVLPRAAPARARGASDDRRPERPDPLARAEQRPDRADGEAAAAGAAHRRGLPARHPRARPLRPGDRVRARLHARPRRLGRQAGPGDLLLRRERPLRACEPGVQPDRLRQGEQPARGRRRPATVRTRFEHGTRPTCPGGATQPAPDGSSPWPFGGCDPSSGPPSEDPPG